SHVLIVTSFVVIGVDDHDHAVLVPGEQRHGAADREGIIVGMRSKNEDGFVGVILESFGGSEIRSRKKAKHREHQKRRSHRTQFGLAVAPAAGPLPSSRNTFDDFLPSAASMSSMAG